jgi:hypothetical protein
MIQLAPTANASLRLFLTIATALSLSGCVSLNIGPKPPHKANGVEFRAPPQPFAELSGTDADHAWHSSQSGNSISFISTCNETTELNLEAATAELSSGLENVHTIASQTVTMSGREALVSEVEGNAEGVATRLKTAVFRKNGCLYSISLVGLSKKFDIDRSAFDEFLKGFRAP